jgi:hypothetical protein
VTVYKIVALAKPGSDADDRTTARDTGMDRGACAPPSSSISGGISNILKSSPATRHMVVIHRAGHVVYMGAIDDTPSTRLADVKTAPT